MRAARCTQLIWHAAAAFCAATSATKTNVVSNGDRDDSDDAHINICCIYAANVLLDRTLGNRMLTEQPGMP